MNEAMNTQSEQAHKQFLQEYNLLLTRFDCTIATCLDDAELIVIFNDKGISDINLSY